MVNRLSALAKILFYLAAVILAAAILSPPIYWGFQALGAQGIFSGIADFPFHRYFSRVAQVTAFVLLVPLLFWLRIRSVREFGLERNPARWRDVVVGFLVAVLPVAVLGAVLVFCDGARLRDNPNPADLGVIVLRAGFVATIEEFLFRGVLFGLAARAFGVWPGAVGVSAAFAAVHFLKPAKSATGEVTWRSGFDQIASVWTSAPPAELLAWGMASLFVIGMILALAARRTRSLWLPIGLHAGWIFGQQTLRWLTKSRVKDDWLPWMGTNVVSGMVPTGIVPLLVLLLSGVGVWLYLRHDPARRHRRDA